MIKTSSLYIHIPFCISKCAYCDFFSQVNNRYISNEYIDALCNELLFRIKDFNLDQIKTIYIGGGTPSLLTESQIKKIVHTIQQNSNLTTDYEFTFEINPDDVSIDFLQVLNNCGVNRISLGIQSLNPSCLEFVGRRASLEQNLQALKCIKENWNGVFSVDLICGLPFETKKSFFDCLDVVFSFSPHHISMYSLTIEEETRLGKLIYNKQIDYDYDFSDKLWILSKQKLERRGYAQYEVSNFCLKGFECKHNLVYWNHLSYVGAGSGATGTIRCVPKKNIDEDFRYTNTVKISQYIDYWSGKNKNPIPQEQEYLNEKTSMFEFFMMGLRKVQGISKNHFEKVFLTQLPKTFVELIEEWKQKKLAVITRVENDTFYSLSEGGILFLNNFLEELEL